MATIHVHDTWAAVDAEEWDALVAGGSPFLESPFLFGLEQTGCAVADRGWAPRPILVRDDDGRLLAGAPAWLKNHSMGEFVYDHGWAHAAEQAGIPYYPKLIVGVPFSPVTGERLLVRPGEDRERWVPALLQGLNELLKESAHGLHVLFDPGAEARELERYGAFTRLQYQFHWTNEGYERYADFLARFRSSARKKLRRERREVGDLRIERVVAPSAEQMDYLFGFYADTCEKYVWGRRYLNRAFFQHLARTWSHRVLGVLAWDGDRCVAGAFDVFKGDRLYGRYWGCHEDVKFLHFEVCYHQGIEFCIERGLQVFEPGHGGEHKYRRGFLPTLTYSSHWFPDPRLSAGLGDFAQREAAAVRRQVHDLRERAPLKDVS